MAGSEDQKAGSDKVITDSNNNNNNNGEIGSGRGEKYALRPRTLIKRLQQDKVRQDIPKRTPLKSKSRPAPLSKYRRKTANARERLRMREINNAFESLRRVLPEGAEVQTNSTSAITKIMTLRLAVEYIKALSYVLEDDSDQPFSTLGDSLHTCLHHSLPLSLHKTLQQPSRVASTHPHSQSIPLHHRTSTQITHYTTCNTITSSTTPVLRTSVSSSTSNSDFEEIFSDDSGLLEEGFDVFHDLQALAAASDPFDILLGSADKDPDGIGFSGELHV